MKKIDLKSIVLWGVLGAFAIGGAFQSMFGVNNPVLAKVGSSSIKAVDVRRFIPLIPIPEGMYKESSSVQNYVFFQALNMAVQRELVNLECKRLGFIVSNFQVKESIKRNKNFMESGSFSRSKYLEFLKKQNMTEAEFFSFEKENLLHRQWYFMLGSAYAIPSKLANTMANAFSQRRWGKYQVLDYSSLKVRNPSLRELKAFYEKNKASYEVPESRKILAVELKSEGELTKFIELAKKDGFEKACEKYSLETKDLAALEGKKNVVEVAESQSRYFKVGDAFPFSLFGKFLALKLESVKAAFVPNFSSIKSDVLSSWKKNFRKTMSKKILPAAWKSLPNMRFQETLSGVPESVLKALFYNKEKSLVFIEEDEEDKIYKLKIDQVIFPKLFPEEVEGAKAFVSQEILKDIVESAISSLRLRYNVRYSI